MSMNTCKKMFAAVLAAATMITSIGVSFAEETTINYIDQTVLDSDYNKANITSSFAQCANTDYSQSGDDTTSNPTYTGISEENIIRFDWQPTQVQAENWQWLGIILGTKEQLFLNEKNDTVTYNNYSDSSTTYTQSFSYDFANDTETVYNVYIEKTNGVLVFGIKKSSEEAYTGIKIADAVNDGYNCIRMRTFGFRVKVSNAYVYTKKVPMPEVAQEVLDSDYDVYDAKDAIFNNGDTYSINNKSTTSYNGLSDNSVIKITMKPGKQTDSWQNMCLYLGENETITFNQSTDKITYTNSKTNETKTTDYDFANDGTSDTEGVTEYNVYVAKIDGAFVFGIKKTSETMYVWFNIDNAQSDDYTMLKFGTNGYWTGVSNAYVYTKKNEIPLPTIEELTLNYELKKDDSSVFAVVATAAGENEERNSATVSDVALNNYVTYFKAAFSDLGSYDGDGFVFDFGRDKVTFNIYNGGIKYNTESENAIGYTFAANKVYDIAAAKTGSRFVFGIKSADEEKYTWFEKTSAENDNTDYLKATENYIGANVSEFKLYTLKDYQYGNVGTVTADNRLTSTFKITRTNQDTIDTGVFITAVYCKGEYPVMDSVAATEVKALTLDSEVTFENTISLPADGEYEVKYFLWKNFDELIPVVSNIK